MTITLLKFGKTVQNLVGSKNDVGISQAQPGGVVGYQYTPFFPPGIPIYLKTAKKVDTKYLKLLPKRHVRQQRLV